MTDEEESLMHLGMQLRDGLSDMVNSGRLSIADIPDDFAWLADILERMRVLGAKVQASLND